MNLAGHTGRERTPGDAGGRFAGNEPPKPPPAPPALYSPVSKTDIARLKSMTEDELIAALRNNENPAHAQMIMAELLKPNWALVAGFWAVIAGIAVMAVAVVFFHTF